MKQQDIHTIIQQKYSYNPKQPDFVSVDGRYKIFNATQKQITINVSIKILMNGIQPSLNNYLSKLKSSKSQQVIKIYQIINETNFLVLVTQQVTFGTLGAALLNCKKLDQSDAVFLGKYLLLGYADILRTGIQWFGTTNDIQITQSGIKLSWNNAIPMNQQSANTLKQVIQSISSQKIPQNEPRLLPFPQSKQIKQICKLSQGSASQISLAPILKKKQKYLKKKFKQYLLIRQIKNTNEYFDQTVYLGIHKDHGFVRVKSFKKGVLNPTIVQLNKTKTTFTKIVQIIEDVQLVYIVSLYSNDGNLQNYVTRLKNAGVQLKQDQIEFFFFSMFEPLKAIQQSSLKSLSTSLNIKNIYIQSGIPKIGQPLPLNQETKQNLIERADVPDFYHPKFKQQPNSSDPSYDTYSLGVLLYKLMFTQYPIFPNGKVHIPTTPTYSPRLKKTLQIFLNQGGKLNQIQKKIEVSQSVIKQVKKNKQKLLNAKKIQQKKVKGQRKRFQQIIALDDEDIQHKKNQDEQKDKLPSEEDQQEELFDDCFDCCVNFDLADHTIDPQVESLEQSPYKAYRLCTKLLVFLLFYILLFYMFYLKDNINMLTNQSKLNKMNVTISTVNYQIITTDSNQFYLQFNQTSKTLIDLANMGCFIDSYNGSMDYSQFTYSSSSRWLLYLIGGLALFLLIIIMKSILIFSFDYIRAKYNYQHNLTNFNYTNYIMINLFIAALINQHFQFFNLIFYSTLPGCLGCKNGRVYSTTFYMYNDNPDFLLVHLPLLCGFTFLTFIYFLIVHNTQKIKYSKIKNPIIFLMPFLLGYWVVVRIGVPSSFFYPSVLNDSKSIISNYFKDVDYIGIIGIIPQILFGIQFILNKIIDLFYWMLIDKKRRVLIQQYSTQNIQIHQ